MVDKNRRTKPKSDKRPKLKYFFLEGDLHKKLNINRGADTLTAWNYPQGKRMVYAYSIALKRYKPAFTTNEVAAMMMRERQVLIRAIKNGDIEVPQNTYALNEGKNFYQYMWSEDDIMDLLKFLSTIHRGRPRKDGEITTQHLPTPVELRAIIRNEEPLYVRNGDAFVPTWKAKDI